MSGLKNFIAGTEKTLKEGAEPKLAVFAFGRFNPPTKGHLKLISAVHDIAKEKGGTPFVFPSHTVDKPVKKTGKVDPERSKNPLDWETKVALMKRVFPHDEAIVRAPEVKSPHDVMQWLIDRDFTDAIFVVGSDRVQEFENRWIPYAKDALNSASIESAGSRDPDGDGVVGMSASKAREVAKTNEYAKFAAATGWSGNDARDMLKAVRKGMGLEE